MTARSGRSGRAIMTPPPPALPRLQTGIRRMRRRAPVSDRPAGSLLAGSSLPTQGESLSEVLSAPIALFHVGIDWAAETHLVCVIDDAGLIQSSFPIRHTADGFAELIRRLGKLGDRADVSVGIERPDGRLVDALLEAGHPVVR